MFQSETSVRAALRLFALILLGMCALLPGNAWAADVTVDCTGNTPGAFTTINDALGTLDTFGPHSITVMGSCNELVRIIHRQSLTIQSAPGISAAIIRSGESNVVVIDGSTDINIRGILINGGVNGVVVRNFSLANIFDSTIAHNLATGISVSNYSTLYVENSNIRDNRQQGIQVAGSRLTVESCIIENNGSQGVNLNQSRATIYGSLSESIFRGNGGTGLRAIYSSWVAVYGPARFVNNAAFGISIHFLSSLDFEPGFDANDMPIANVIEGNAMGGINSGWGSHDNIYGPLLLRNNGSATDPTNSVGINVALNGSLTLIGDATDPIWDVVISGNWGPGILAREGEIVTLQGVKILNNSGDGVTLAESSGIFVLPQNSIAGNAGANISCDATGWIAGDWTGISKVDCRDSGNKNPNRKSLFRDKEKGEGKDK